jgi:hypothetical protein
MHNGWRMIIGEDDLAYLGSGVSLSLVGCFEHEKGHRCIGIGVLIFGIDDGFSLFTQFYTPNACSENDSLSYL